MGFRLHSPLLFFPTSAMEKELSFLWFPLILTCQCVDVPWPGRPHYDPAGYCGSDPQENLIISAWIRFCLVREPCLGNWARSQQSTDLPLCGAVHRASMCSKAGRQAQEHMTSVSSGFEQHADQKEKWPKYRKSHLNFLVLGFQRSSLVWVLHRELLYVF